MKNKVCIVTGGNSGIGLVTAKEFSRMGAKTVIVARDAHRGDAALDEIRQYSNTDNTELMLCDFSSQSSIKAFTDEFKKSTTALTSWLTMLD